MRLLDALECLTQAYEVTAITILGDIRMIHQGEFDESAFDFFERGCVGNPETIKRIVVSCWALVTRRTIRIEYFLDTK